MAPYRITKAFFAFKSLFICLNPTNDRIFCVYNIASNGLLIIEWLLTASSQRGGSGRGCHISKRRKEARKSEGA